MKGKSRIALSISLQFPQTLRNLNRIDTSFLLQYDILPNRDIVLDSSAWAGLEEDAPVDEVEAVRIISGEPPGLITILRRERAKLISNDQHKTLLVM